jgi:type III pantothenate kinase
MILCLDCGNSRLKWGLRDGADWYAAGAVPLADISKFVQQLPADFKPDSVIGCNVAGEMRERQIESALKCKVTWVTASATQCSVTNGYDVPIDLGADRWAAMIAAHQLHRGPVLVVMAGTATTIDVVNSDGRHQGGLILPGITLMSAALNSGTAQLPHARGAFQQMPHNTHDAIVSGAIQATLGAIQRMFTLLSTRDEGICLLSGGNAALLQPFLEIPSQQIETLVLDGLAEIAIAQGRDPA